MKKKATKLVLMFLRYLFLVILGLNLWLFYLILTPVTIFPSFFLIKLFLPASLSGITITIKSFSIKLVEACIAGSAYFLLFILNFTTPMKPIVRIKSLIFSCLLLLIINIARIVVFSLLFISSFSLFNTLHLIVWYGLSALIVVFVWLATIKIFKIKQIPVYFDIKYLWRLIKNKR